MIQGGDFTKGDGMLGHCGYWLRRACANNCYKAPVESPVSFAPLSLWSTNQN